MASVWPGVILAALGAGTVLYPRLARLQPYLATAVRDERSVLSPELLAWARAVTAVQGSVLLGLLITNAVVGAYGLPHLLDVLLAFAWPLLGLALGMVGTRLLPVSWRRAGLVVFPLVMYACVVGAGQLDPGPVATLSPINVLVLPTASEHWSVGLLRVLAVLGATVALWAAGRRVWWQRVGTAAVVAAVMGAAALLPAPMVPIPGADAPRCQIVHTTRVCWSEWSRASVGVLVDALEPVLSRTPADLRPAMVLSTSEPMTAPGALWIGHPDATNYVAAWPTTAALRRTYAGALVTSTCQMSPVAPLLIQRTARALGVDHEQLLAGELSEAQLRSQLEGSDRLLMDRLNRLPDARFFPLLVRLSRDQRLCAATADTWLAELDG